MKKEKILLNLTPHEIVYDDGVNGCIKIQPYGIVTRVTTSETLLKPITNLVRDIEIKQVESKVGSVTSLPKFDSSVDYVCIVSRMVLDHCPKLDNVTWLAPDTGVTAIRNSAGQIMAVRQFIAQSSS